VKKKTRVGVLGATGFTGEKLVDILIKHPNVEVCYLASRTEKPVYYSDLFACFSNKTNLKCEPLSIEKSLKKCDFLFLSLPHTVSMKFVPYLLKAKKKVVDLSADYRLQDSEEYKKYYRALHEDKKNLKKAVYGLPELYKVAIGKAQLVANPGCYPTSMILPLFPLLKEGLIELKVVIDSKSSITGAGKKAIIDYHYINVSNNIWAYKPFTHQHVPEAVNILKAKTQKEVDISFTPHVVGIDAGIYSTIYVWFKKKVKSSQLFDLYQKHYRNCPFVRIKNNLPKLKEVVGSNYCDIGFELNENGKQAVVVSCIDNLIKGAAGQAVENMNIMLGCDQTTGLQ